MEEIEVALNLVKMGKPLTALNFIKQFLKNNPSILIDSEECKNLANIVLHFPSLNDESWRYFIHIEKEDAELLIEKIKDCLKV
ncbi:hypothetical protein SJAV_08080 [Sulfurisphaera javensis]|uniref:Uncharacterized protein n=1 Tax=Sulfurisphaera javensis TaxID=2049879 RepID=A0AAT9GQ79_9CREN